MERYLDEGCGRVDGCYYGEGVEYNESIHGDSTGDGGSLSRDGDIGNISGVDEFFVPNYGVLRESVIGTGNTEII